MLMRLSLALAASLTLVVLAVQPVLSVDPDFSDRRTFGRDWEYTARVALGDMDGDGDLDIIVGKHVDNVDGVNDGGTSAVYLNDGTGNFPQTGEHILDNGFDGTSTCSIAVGDMNGDGALDVVTGKCQWNHIPELDDSGLIPSVYNAVYINAGTASSFLSRPFGTGAANTVSVAVGDMDSDGDLDIVTGNTGEQGVVYYNDGDGDFPLSDAVTFNTELKLAIRDLAVTQIDADNCLDIVVDYSTEQGLSNDSSQYLVFLNDCNGHFGTTPSLITGMDRAAYAAKGKVIGDMAAIGDMDGDGDLDSVVAVEDGQSYIHFQGNSDDLLDPIGVFGADRDATRSVAIGDLDGDHDLDIVAGNYNAQSAVYLNDSSGSFPAPHTLTDDPATTRSVAVGDMDHNGALDIVVGRSGGQHTVYFNDGQGSFPSRDTREFGALSDVVESIAVGDMNCDDALDIVVGSPHFEDHQDYSETTNRDEQGVVYLNNGKGGFPITSTVPFNYTSVDDNESIAIGDMDGNGYLDIIAGGYENSIIFFNNGSCSSPSWSKSHLLSDLYSVESIAVGDLDGDGDLDIAAGAAEDDNTILPLKDSGALYWQNKIILNDGAGNFPTTATVDFGTSRDATRSIALGDMDSDGDLDIVAGNYHQQNVVYRNDGAGNFPITATVNFGTGFDDTETVAVGDMNGDGDLDILVGNSGEQSAVYLNDGRGSFAIDRSFGDSTSHINSLAVGDMDADGDLDIVGSNYGNPDFLILNNRTGSPPTQLQLLRPGMTPNANFYSMSNLEASPLITLTYWLTSTDSTPVGRVAMEYSFDGGGYWWPAIPAAGTLTTNRATSPAGISHVFTWDTLASGFFGQSDNVVLRLVAYVQTDQIANSGTYRYVNLAVGPFQHASYATQTFPFRVRGTQVRVLQGDEPTPNAIVYRLAADDQRAGQVMGSTAIPLMARDPIESTSMNTIPYSTSQHGYLSGRGQLDRGDRLVALAPITPTETYTVYYTSPISPSTGIPTAVITQAGVQPLNVSSDNPLMLFNLDVALEWDATKDDGEYLSQLKYDLSRTSALLYDWTNGQVALGRVRIFHDAPNQPTVKRHQLSVACDPEAEVDCYQPWLDGHIRIYASNAVHPNAIQGGIVTAALTEPVKVDGGRTITYTPGMVHIGSVWNRYAESSSLGEDWPRALAHELGHYLFFLDDNYLGYIGAGANGRLEFVSSDPIKGCPGAMNDPYTDHLGEFHPQAGWQTGCEQTYSHQSLGRSDWETIVAHYPWLKAPGPDESIDKVEPGPSGLRLAFTQFEVIPPAPAADSSQTLDQAIFTISADGKAYQPRPGARAILFQGERLVDLGAPVLDQLVARGARDGDTLCLLEPGSQGVSDDLDNWWVGCAATLPGADQLVIQSIPNWKPQVIVTPVNSRTLTIRVEGISSELLQARIFPRDGAATAPLTLTATSDGFTGTFELKNPVFEGNLYIWDANDNDRLRQVVVDFVVGSNPQLWDARNARWRARLARWRARLVPVISNGGEVAILGDNVAFGDNDWLVSLQAATAFPNLPEWATPIGKGYWLHTTKDTPSLDDTTISFNYDSRDVPPGLESWLRLFYRSADVTVTNPISMWVPLTTTVIAGQNLASAPNHGAGLYVLAAAVPVSLRSDSWSVFSYNIPGDPKPVGTALKATARDYSIVYTYDPADQGNPWRAFDPKAPPFANDLIELAYGKTYWIHANRTTTVHLAAYRAAGSAPPAQAGGASPGLVPPAVFYGQVQRRSNNYQQPNGDFSLTAGMEVTAWIGDHLCGQAQTREQDGNDGNIVFVVKVAADGDTEGCGAAGRTVEFKVGDRKMVTRAPWDNTNFTYALLSTENGHQQSSPTF